MIKTNNQTNIGKHQYNNYYRCTQAVCGKHVRV